MHLDKKVSNGQHLCCLRQDEEHQQKIYIHASIAPEYIYGICLDIDNFVIRGQKIGTLRDVSNFNK